MALEGLAEYESDVMWMRLRVLPLLASATEREARFQKSRRGRKIDEVVIHDTGSSNPFKRTSAYLAHPKDGRKVSIHYLIGRDVGQFVKMVPEDRRANHAINHNARSIGIELWRHKNFRGDFTSWQYQVVSQLVYDIMRRHGIKLDNVVGHGEIYRNKRGEPHGFSWSRFYHALVVINEKAKAYRAEFNVL